jgi:hypothetical protein
MLLFKSLCNDYCLASFSYPLFIYLEVAIMIHCYDV